MTIHPFDKRLQDDISVGVAAVLRANTGTSPEDALKQVTIEMLANNPFVPPSGCPVNDLPTEVLAYIFDLGVKIDEEDLENGSDSDDDGIDLAEDWETTTDEEDDGDDAMDVIETTPAKARKSEPHSPLASSDIEIPDSSDMEDAEDAEGEEEEEVGPKLAFQVLVSHVCKHWREVALESHSLWTTLNFFKGASIDKCRTYVERSKGQPLSIFIDCTAPDGWDPPDTMGHFLDPPDTNGVVTPHTMPGDYGAEEDELPFLTTSELTAVLDLTIPHVAQWRLFEVTVSLYPHMYQILSRIAQCPSAPVLEELGLYHYEDCEEYEAFQPPELNTAFLPFHGIIPNLRCVALWGVHVAWDDSLSFLRGLHEMELAYHARDVRPSYATFTSIFEACPAIHTLSLCISGPSGSSADWGEPIQLPSLQELVLCYHEAPYIESLIQFLVLPDLRSLTLDFDAEDYTSFARRLASPATGQTKSLLSRLENLKIAGLPCDNKSTDLVMAELENLKTFNINCSGDEERFFDRLNAVAGKRPKYCPNLNVIFTTGIDGAKLRKFVDMRRQAGAPLSKVFMSEQDDLDPKDEKWLKNHLDALEFFEPSDEEEFSDVDMDMDMDDIDVDEDESD